MTALLVFLGAATGATARHLVDRAVRRPWGILLVNVAGSFVLGCVAGANPSVLALVGTGFCGGLTTYSTFSLDTVRLLEAGAHTRALANVALNVVLGTTAAALGLALTR